MSKSAKYSMTFQVNYRLSRDGKHYAQYSWRSVSKLPAQIVFGLEDKEELSFKEFVNKHRHITLPRGSHLTLMIKNIDNGKSYAYAFDINKDWQAPDDWGGIVSRVGSLDLTKAIKAVL